MFTLEQIQTAHGKVKSGADFPAYIKEIKDLGVTHYEAYVSDGHIDYHGTDGHGVEVPAKYETLGVADQVDQEEFKTQLRAHQQGKTDYPNFIRMCAKTGIEKWIILMEDMTCTYYDKAGHTVLVEIIPQA
ncbi:DUF1398 domain-containing protein [Sphingobacterium sp.]|uniref:DUF1398 domain-containing protein n=1 Tax=Sphingobacterium sp. TaxID=341027 RepID=UPI0028A160A0|nr:DUF1398 family protein [Sphingobacterium sp.]